ncbi:hypothetical protein QQ045_023730 [Rhodiola kirilowii]
MICRKLEIFWIGLETLMSGARMISDGMLHVAAECLASYMTDEEVQQGILYPSIDRIWDVTVEVQVGNKWCFRIMS